MKKWFRSEKTRKAMKRYIKWFRKYFGKSAFIPFIVCCLLITFNCKSEVNPYAPILKEKELPEFHNAGFVDMPTIYDQPLIKYFSLSPKEIDKGESIQLSWKVKFADSVEINTDNSTFYRKIEQDGSLDHQPKKTTTYILLAENDHGISRARANVVVNIPPPPAPKIIEVEICLASAIIPNGNCKNKEIREFEEGTEPTTICDICKPPPQYIDVELCSHSELLPNAYCQDKEIKQFIIGEEPTEICNICEEPIEYVDIEICSHSEILPNAYCDDIEIRQYIKGEEPTESCTICEAEVYVELDGHETWDKGKDGGVDWVSVSDEANCLGDLGGIAYNVIVTVKICLKDGTADDSYTRSISLGDMNVGESESWTIRWDNVKWNELWKDHQKNKTIFEIIWD